MNETQSTAKPGLLERLAIGPVICAEGYLFELERRGYLQAGPFVPEVVIEHPEVVTRLHEDFVHAGSDVVEAFTYYAHRQKLKVIGREDILELINRQALRIAKDVADRHGGLMAGNICNTNAYEADDPKTHKAVRAMFEEQIGWAVEEGADFLIAETIDWYGEAAIALDVMKASGLPTVVTLSVHRNEKMFDGMDVVDACKRLEAAGADVVGLNCQRGPKTLMPVVKRGTTGPFLSRGIAPGSLPDDRQPSRRFSRSPTAHALAFPAIGRSRLRSIHSPAIATNARSMRARLMTSGSATSDFAVATLLITSVQSRKRWDERCRVAATHPICRNMPSSVPMQRFRINTKSAKSRFDRLRLTCGPNCCTVKRHDKFP